MTQAASNSPKHFEAINMVIERFMSEVHTCMPAKIVSYDSATQSATVQPSFKERFVGQPVQSMPQISNVPVIQFATESAWFRVPVKAGDTVMLHFAERSIDQWWSHGGEVEPNTPTMFGLSDAIAVLGLRPRMQAIQPKAAEDSIEMANGQGWFEITADGKFKMKNSGAELLTILDSFFDTMAAMTTINCVPGSPVTLDPSVITKIELAKSKLALLKAS